MSCHLELVTFPGAASADGYLGLCTAVICEEEGDKWGRLTIKSNHSADRVIRNTSLSWEANAGGNALMHRCSLILAVIQSSPVLLQVALDKRIYSQDRFCWHSEAISFCLFVK